jgi:hypothetical protein
MREEEMVMGEKMTEIVMGGRRSSRQRGWWRNRTSSQLCNDKEKARLERNSAS